MNRRSLLILLAAACSLLADSVMAQEGANYVPQPGKFPPPNSGKYLAGELVFIDPVNRRGGLRLDGNGGERYHSGPLHYFSLLPYGEVSYCGAPAELKDIPLGTHVHGQFYVPPVGEEATIPPLPKDMAKYEIKQNHAVSLEDDFSSYQRRGQGWKVVSIDMVKGKINVMPTGQLVKDGINTAYTFDIDDITKFGRAARWWNSPTSRLNKL